MLETGNLTAQSGDLERRRMHTVLNLFFKWGNQAPVGKSPVVHLDGELFLLVEGRIMVSQFFPLCKGT